MSVLEENNTICWIGEKFITGCEFGDRRNKLVFLRKSAEEDDEILLEIEVDRGEIIFTRLSENELEIKGSSSQKFFNECVKKFGFKDISHFFNEVWIAEILGAPSIREKYSGALF